MVYWRSLEHRCVEAAANSKCRLSTAKQILGPAQLSRLIGWFASHNVLADKQQQDDDEPEDEANDNFSAIVRGLLCDEVRCLNLDVGNVRKDFLIELAERCGPTLEYLRIGCSFKVFDDEMSRLMGRLTNIRYLDIRELKIDRPSGVLDQLIGGGGRLESVFLQLYVRDARWSELESLVEGNRSIRCLRVDIRGRTLRNEDLLLTKIADNLKTTLTELDLHNFAAGESAGALNYLLTNCRNLTKLRLTGSMQFEPETMRQVQANCGWRVLELTFQVTPPRLTYDALQYLPATLTEISYKFGPSNRRLIVESISKLPALKRLRYHTEFFNDALMVDLLSSLGGGGAGTCANLECLDVGLCDSLTDLGLEALAQACPNLKELYLHSDTVKYNRVATCSPLCLWFDRRDQSIDIDDHHLRVMYFNYFKALSADFLRIVAASSAECSSSSSSSSNLRELHLASVRCVDDALLEFVAARCPNLTTVDVMNCWAVTDRGILALAAQQHLINLNVGMCYRLTPICVVGLARNCWSSLERFIYHGIPRLKRNPAIEELKRACEKPLKTYWYQWLN